MASEVLQSGSDWKRRGLAKPLRASVERRQSGSGGPGGAFFNGGAHKEVVLFILRRRLCRDRCRRHRKGRWRVFQRPYRS